MTQYNKSFIKEKADKNIGKGGCKDFSLHPPFFVCPLHTDVKHRFRPTCNAVAIAICTAYRL